MITADRLSLRPLRMSDADWIAADIANPLVQCWLTTPPHPYGFDDAVAFLEPRAGGPYVRAIMHGCEPLGVIALENELGYWLKQAAWGQGFMTEAAVAFLSWHFARSDDDVQSGWIDGNQGSARVQDKLGFRHMGVVRKRSEFHDADVPIIQTVLSAKDWRAAMLEPGGKTG